MEPVRKFIALAVVALALIGAGFGQSTDRDQYTPNAVEFAAKTFTFRHIENYQHFGVQHNFEFIWGSAPATTSISINGVMRGGTSTPLLTNALLVNQVLTVAGSYDFFDVVVTWTGSPTSVKLNITGSPQQPAEKGNRTSPTPSAPAAGSQATVSVAAGGANVRHVADCVSFAGASVVAPALTAVSVNLRDGATGAGTIKHTWTLAVSAATGQNIPPFSVCGLNIQGSFNTAMTLEFSAAVANLSESVALTTFDTN